MSRTKRAFAAIALILSFSLGSIAVFAPQVFVLATEGFPSETWTGRGSFVTVRGVRQADRQTGTEISPEAKARFEAAEGRALLVQQGDRLVYESYSADLSANDRLNSFSLVKSLVGALVVRAVADGKLSLDDPLSTHLGADAPNATIGQVLAMRSGLVMDGEPAKTVDDAGFSPFGPLARLHAFGTAAVLSDLRVDPAMAGEFAYQSVNTALLGEVLQRVYDIPLPELLSRLIWAPAGAADAEWRVSTRGNVVSAYCCLFARPIDWLRVGRFLMNNGTPDQPFLPQRMWQDFLLPELSPEVRRQGAYGWHIRHDVLDRDGASVQGPFAYFMGHNGQIVYLLPEQDTVVVRFGGRMQLLHSTLYDLLPVD